MNRDNRPSTRTTYHGLNGGPAPSPRPPSWWTIATFTALPIAVIAAVSFPTAAAVALALFAGVAAGAALQRRYPNALTRAVRSPAREPSAARRR